MPCHLRRVNEKEYARLKNIGKDGGKLQAKISNIRNTTKLLTTLPTIRGRVTKYRINPTIHVSIRK